MLNWSRVTELQNDLGAEDFDEITSLFLEEVEEKLDFLSANRSDTMAPALHFLKGSAANLGFEAFRTMCEQMEQSLVDASIETLIATYEQSKCEFIDGLKQQKIG